MQVLVMRHGIALEREDWAADDTLRPLSKAGWKKARLAARGLKYLCPRIDLIAFSPLLRARQTAQVAREVLEVEREAQAWPELALLLEEDAEMEPLRARIQAAASTCVLLVGHEPGCSRLLSLLMDDDADAIAFDWKKAGVASIQIEPERVSLSWFASPKMLRALARTSGR